MLEFVLIFAATTGWGLFIYERIQHSDTLDRWEESIDNIGIAIEKHMDTHGR